MKLTVVQLLPAMEMGGVERGTLEVAAELVRRGHRAIVISAGGRLVRDLTAAGAEHLPWSIGRKSLLSLRHILPLRRLLAATGADILHARSRLPAWIGYLAWKGLPAATRPRFVTTVHGPYSVNRYSGVMVRGERVIAISEWIRSYILRGYPEVDPARIQVIPRGVDPAHFKYGYRPEAGWIGSFFREFPHALDKRILTLPARITRRKGHADFLAMMAALVRLGLPVHGLVVGSAAPRQARLARELAAQVRAMKLDRHVSFTGGRSDVREIMAISDVVLNLAVEPEGFGRTTVEALSLGRPVIGYDHSGTAEVLGTIFPLGLTPPGDIAALTRKVEAFLRDPPPVPPGQPYTLQAMLGSTLDLYEALATGDHRR